MNFKDFLFNEDHVYLGQRIGDVLTSLQQLKQDSVGMGARAFMLSAESIVDQIRSILHTSWHRSEMQYLPVLQKTGVAIMKAIENKDDLKMILDSAITEFEQLSTKLGVPQNSLGTDDLAQ